MISGQILSPGKIKPFRHISLSNPMIRKMIFFRLKSTNAEVNIAGVIADVTITQDYRNEGKKPIEAIYVFPASTQAAVYSMVMTIGERVIVARIRGKGKSQAGI